MIPMTLSELAGAVEGQLSGTADPLAVVTGPVVVDSRSVSSGGLFVALRGEHHDGHDFAEAAAAAGAVAVLADRPVPVPAVVVPDVPTALGRLARSVVHRLPDAVIVGVTGSSGKTGTKDLIAGLTGRLGTTVAAPGSWNNEIGHPLTALRADEATRYLVLEYSARSTGHIAALCAVAPPRIGVVLNVGTAHLGVFGSREAIAAAKGELVEALPADGLAVLNADDPRVLGMRSRTRARVVTVGCEPSADVRADDIRLDRLGRPQFTVRLAGQAVPVALGLHGVHHVGNALAAVAVAVELGLPLEAAAAVLATARPVSRWRMEVCERPDGVSIVNDAYNANPESMSAALDALAVMGRGGEGELPRRTWAVLGGMAELGPAAAAAHAAIGARAVALGIDRIICVGSDAAGIAAAAAAALETGREGPTADRTVLAVPDRAAALAVLRRDLAPGDVVLVKASRVAALEQIAAALTEDLACGTS